MTTRTILRSLLLVAIALAPFMAHSAPAQDRVTVAALRFVSSGPLFIARDKGYFEDEGLDAQFEFFEAAQPVAVAIASGDADFGVTAFTAGFFNIASQGALQVVAAQLHEVEGFEGSAILASNQAYDEGLTTVAQLPGHSFALTQTGSSFHYMIGQIAENAGFALDDMALKPLQSVGNMIGALRTGQVDSMVIVPHIAKPLVAAGNAHLLGWVSDYAPYQVGGLFTSTANVEDHADTVRRFVRAYQRGVADYRAAFMDGDTDMRAEVVAIIHNYVYQDQPAAEAEPKIRNGAMYITEDAALNAADVREQVRWYQARGLVNAAADPDAFINADFVATITNPGE
ncbi:MAG TPA: ABC transporter substrate-binding protein [Salinisphaeraceae bacterium]|nr:ABC transporter substrate-binding protein [Salinisphaeraceae bacterium]